MRSGDLLAFKIKKKTQLINIFLKVQTLKYKKNTHTQIRKYTDIIN
jgi:hypothetical protein